MHKNAQAYLLLLFIRKAVECIIQVESNYVDRFLFELHNSIVCFVISGRHLFINMLRNVFGASSCAFWLVFVCIECLFGIGPLKNKYYRNMFLTVVSVFI